MFDKSPGLFPIKKRFVFLNSCGVSPLYISAARNEAEFAALQAELGNMALAVRPYQGILDDLHAAAAELLHTSSDNISFVKSTAEGLCLVANAYPLAAGDQIINYIHEYPANHYPWRLQEKRGAELVLLPDACLMAQQSRGHPTGWAMADLERLVTDRTRIVALSHVQFTSGFAADLAELGGFCRARGIDLVIDAAQSLGCLPIYPDEWGVSVVAASGWKWLLGPIGSSLMYTSKQFRAKLECRMAGANLMRQGDNYLDHTWAPIESGGMFEYSTVPVGLALAVESVLREIFLKYGTENIATEVLRLQDMAYELFDKDRLKPMQFPHQHRSGILALAVDGRADELAKAAQDKGIVCTARGGYLRFAPHFYVDEGEIERAVSILNSLV